MNNEMLSIITFGVERTIEIDDSFSLVWDSYEGFSNCFYLRVKHDSTRIEIWGPGTRWGNLEGTYPDAYIVILSLDAFDPPWELLGGPFDTLKQASEIAINMHLLLGE